MFPRKKKNRTGTISVVVVDKSRGGFKEVKSFGVAKTEEEADRLYAKASEWIRRYGGQQEIDFVQMYFETGIQDELRTNGFSKDGKTSESQIILGLLVSADSYPLSYSIFKGAQYEGRTMIPIIDDFIQRFDIKDFVVVADSGLLNKTSVELLRQAGYKYILGARIKKESADVAEWILAQEKVSCAYHEFIRKNGERLIVGYSEQRARKDAHNREKGIDRLRKAYSSGVLTKASINRRGYNKFLTISKDMQVIINEEEIENDAKWDGLKGYVTNTDLDAEQVVDQYHSLWYVERAFRVTKGNLEARPIFHFTEKRIEAHICICFIAYKVYKELGRIIALHGRINLSVDKVIDIAKTIPTIKLSLPYGDVKRVKTLFLTEKHQKIKPLFDIKAILDKKNE